MGCLLCQFSLVGFIDGNVEDLGIFSVGKKNMMGKVMHDVFSSIEFSCGSSQYFDAEYVLWLRGGLHHFGVVQKMSAQEHRGLGSRPGTPGGRWSRSGSRPSFSKNNIFDLRLIEEEVVV